jgi:hypothetical protein
VLKLIKTKTTVLIKRYFYENQMYEPESFFEKTLTKNQVIFFLILRFCALKQLKFVILSLFGTKRNTLTIFSDYFVCDVLPVNG